MPKEFLSAICFRRNCFIPGLFLIGPAQHQSGDNRKCQKSQFWIYCHEIDKQGPVAQQIYSDQNETPLLSPHLSDRADRNRNSHEEDEAEIGNWSEANQICISLGNEPLSIRQRLGCFAAKSPPAGSLSNHKQADPNADYARHDKDKRRFQSRVFVSCRKYT